MKRPIYLEQEHVDFYIKLEKRNISPLGKINYFIAHFNMTYIEAQDVVTYLDENPGAVNVSPCKECQA